MTAPNFKMPATSHVRSVLSRVLLVVLVFFSVSLDSSEVDYDNGSINKFILSAKKGLYIQDVVSGAMDEYVPIGGSMRRSMIKFISRTAMKKTSDIVRQNTSWLGLESKLSIPRPSGSRQETVFAPVYSGKPTRSNWHISKKYVRFSMSWAF
ncbi:hypothetical protein ACFL6Y_08085 [Elusimicrobiota bacterium]